MSVGGSPHIDIGGSIGSIGSIGNHGIGPDLSYRQLKAIILFQELYKIKRHTLRTLNKTLNTVYSTLVSVSNNINNNYISGVIAVEQYRKYMEKTDGLVEQLRQLPRPLTLRNLTAKDRIMYLHYQLYELVKLCGASSCYDVFKMFCGDEWDLYVNPKYIKLLELYNTMFVPVTVRTSVSKEEFRVVKYTSFTLSIMLKIHGAEITIPINNTAIIIKGYFRDDPVNISRIGGTLEVKYMDLLDDSKIKFSDMDDKLLKSYIDQIPLCDFISLDKTTILNIMSEDIKDLQKMRTSPKGYVVEAFLKSGIKKQYSTITLLLLDSVTHPHALSIIKEDPDLSANIYRILHWSIQKIFDHVSKDADKCNNIGGCIDESSIPYEIRIENMKSNENIKKRAREKLKEIKNSRENNDKAIKYLDGLLRIPFGIYRKEQMLRFLSEFVQEMKALKDEPSIAHIFDKYGTPITENEISQTLNAIGGAFNDVTDGLKSHIITLTGKWNKFKQERVTYLTDVNNVLSDCIYGQDEAKRTIESVIAQWINGEMSGMVFGFQGFPGTGKTSLAKHGIAKCIKDSEGKTRPFYFISLGGAKGGSALLGHSYTYVGSQCGKLAECVQSAKIMNPIFYFDELDKVSDSSCGEEIIRILTHLTDPEQNDHIEDRYFGVEMDLSKALIIFSYNNSAKIDEILLDRIHEVKFKQYNKKDKVHISSKYILPKVLKSHGYAPGSLILSDELLAYIVENYTAEAGVRDMKDKLMDIVREINLRRIYSEYDYPLPFTVNVELVDDILKLRNKITFTDIPPKSQIGWVNGLYATSMGTGGITVIQVFNTPSEQKYHLELTGKLGDVMKESVRCAKTISWGIFGESAKKQVNELWRENALHIHFPAAGTSKDGPSAGAAITTAIISYFSKFPVRNYIAMTGEIDLYGNVRPIGGLQCKIEGAQRAGVKLVLIPRDNESEYKEFAIDYQVKVFAVDNISQVIRVSLIGADDSNFNYAHDIKDETTLSILQYISYNII